MPQPAEPIEVEVERLPEEGEAPRPRARRRPMSPLAAGMIVDLLDLGTRGPRWIVPGFVLGLAVGTWVGRATGLALRGSLGLGLLCGVYCGLPATAPLPLGTLVGAYRTLSARRSESG